MGAEIDIQGNLFCQKQGKWQKTLRCEANKSQDSTEDILNQTLWCTSSIFKHILSNVSKLRNSFTSFTNLLNIKYITRYLDWTTIAPQSPSYWQWETSPPCCCITAISWTFPPSTCSIAALACVKSTRRKCSWMQLHVWMVKLTCGAWKGF